MSYTSDDDELLFSDEEDIPSSHSSGAENWKIAIVDDEEQVHVVTKMVLSNFTFKDRKLEFLSAYSAEEAKSLFAAHNDIAVLLLDVVMETDRSGLDFVDYVRNDLRNTNVRIILRTGQPGQAPEEHVIARYDINDYKEKTELTAQKLYSLMYSCLRSYRDIIALERNREGLERVIASTQRIFTENSLELFAEGIIKQITSLLYADEDAFFGKIAGLVSHETREEIRFIAGTGIFKNCTQNNLKDYLSDALLDTLAHENYKAGFFTEDGHYVAQMQTEDGERDILIIAGVHPKDGIESHMLELFCHNALIAFENLHLRQEMAETQREFVYRLGEAVETRSQETGNHVKRVAEISKFLALKAGMSKKEAEVLKLASPMHDLGKIGIPDAILNKPGKLDDEEWQTMQTHAIIGYNMLSSSPRDLLRMGALVSLEHHEKWDGSGYPHQKASEEISLHGRITAIADVFDALASDRCYKRAWPLKEICAFMKEQKGKHFDPNLVDLLLDNIEEVNAIRERYLDEEGDS